MSSRNRPKRTRGGRKRAGMPPNVKRAIKTEIKRELAKEMELKYFDTNLTVQTALAAGAVLGPFTAVPQGVTSSDRVGDRIRVVRYVINLDVYGNAATTAQDVIRLIWFVWHPVNNAVSGVVPTVALVMPGPVNAHFNWNESDQFEVLSDKQYIIVGNNTAFTSAGEHAHYNQVYTPSSARDRFDADGHPVSPSNYCEFAVGANTSSNQLYLLAICRSAAGPFFYPYVRCEYYDA